MTTTFRMLPISRIQAGIGGSLVAAREAEKAAEAVERVVAAVEAEGELVEVGLKVLGAHAVVRASQPSLQVREDRVNHRQVVLGHLGVIVLGAVGKGRSFMTNTLPLATVGVNRIGMDDC